MKYHLLRSIVFAALVAGMPALASAGTVTVSMHAGRVTIVANDATVGQILDEWARVGHTIIVNADHVFGPPMTLQLVDVPEREALDTVLRSVSGYIAAPRQVQLVNASLYDRVTILPTSQAPAASANPGPVMSFQRPPMPREEDDMPVNMMNQQMLQEQEQAQERARQQQLQRTQQPTSPVLMPYPGMQPPPQGQQGPATSPRPGMPVMTSPTPGVIPQPQNRPGGVNPYQPSVVRPVGPGGGGGSGDGSH